MAVQKTKKSRSKRNMRRSHISFKGNQISTEKETGELHIRHHVSKKGFYKGKLVIKKKK